MPEVFISYAHDDDKSLTDDARGWITGLADRLQKLLGMQKGGSSVTVWMDHRLEPQKRVDVALADRVGRADCFVAVLSPRYLESSWCRDEIDGFVNRVGENAARVFLVEMSPTDRGLWPAGVRNLSAMQFWAQPFEQAAPMPLGWPAPDPASDRPYWRAVTELAHFVSTQLGAAGATGAPAGAERRVWIAEPTDHVLDAWERLAGALRQQGCVVLPSSPGSYPIRSEDEYRAAVKDDVARARLCVQLLGPGPGRRPSWCSTPYTMLQAEAARAAAALGTPLHTWRSPDVVLDTIPDKAYAELLIGAAAGGFEEFQQQVLSRAVMPIESRTAAAVPAAASPTADQPLSVCVTADSPDRPLGQQVIDTLYELGADASLAPEPAPDQSPARWRQEYETMLAESHGVVIVYGATPASWVQAQVQAARKLLSRTRRGTWGALLDGPPGQQPDHGVRSHNLMMLDCRTGIAPDPLARFLTTLRSGSPAAGAHA
jgi:hypothetical protein